MHSSHHRAIRAARIVALSAVGVAAVGLLVGQVRAVVSCDDLARLHAALRQDRELEFRRHDTLRRGDLKRQIVQQLIAGTLGLTEAADRYGALSEDAPHYSPRGLRQAYPGTNDRDRWRRCVVECARVELRDRPDVGVELLPQLTAELEGR
jgi:hypothetical protein